MSRPARPWFRFYVEAVTDPKIRRLTPTQRWVWVCVLAAARQSPTPGVLMVTDSAPLMQTELAALANVRPYELRSALQAMARLGMVELDGEGSETVVSVPNWHARQFESDDVTARTRAFRERSKQRSMDVPRNVRGNGPEAEAETEVVVEVPTSSRERSEPPATDELGHWTYLAYGGRVERSECDALVNYATGRHVEREHYMATVRATRWPSEARSALGAKPDPERAAFTYDADADHDAEAAHNAELADDDARARTEALIAAMRPRGRRNDADNR